ncbi:hypothetical protein EIN_150890 [Entamoeba invadens IP1]|uniref:Uncharacterized protein n=1 Tax=Entamoeba invadens IP1 TaxID=370355 RepID=A0A0A1U8P0_ENTIV|nr:hypothetical protein EIN_150890 [Entamoeba invadens IP1]ELP91212.1 hypothetical protein EIN_150890 [Entamoeba invadens IP1]|eukprot:XP_004257983.1 hypothetical protein EIN_150890 [Entamoeba invadens IP1]
MASIISGLVNFGIPLVKNLVKSFAGALGEEDSLEGQFVRSQALGSSNSHSALYSSQVAKFYSTPFKDIDEFNGIQDEAVKQWMNEMTSKQLDFALPMIKNMFPYTFTVTRQYKYMYCPGGTKDVEQMDNIQYFGPEDVPQCVIDGSFIKDLVEKKLSKHAYCFVPIITMKTSQGSDPYSFTNVIWSDHAFNGTKHSVEDLLKINNITNTSNNGQTNYASLWQEQVRATLHHSCSLCQTQFLPFSRERLFQFDSTQHMQIDCFKVKHVFKTRLCIFKDAVRSFNLESCILLIALLTLSNGLHFIAFVSALNCFL